MNLLNTYYLVTSSFFWPHAHAGSFSAYHKTDAKFSELMKFDDDYPNIRFICQEWSLFILTLYETVKKANKYQNEYS